VAMIVRGKGALGSRCDVATIIIIIIIIIINSLID
jgi:hypothetical protein